MIVTKDEFCYTAEETFASTEMNMIDSVLSTCEKFNVDPELVEPLINRSIKEKMKLDYIELNYMKYENNIIA